MRRLPTLLYAIAVSFAVCGAAIPARRTAASRSSRYIRLICLPTRFTVVEGEPAPVYIALENGSGGTQRLFSLMWLSDKPWFDRAAICSGVDLATGKPLAYAKHPLAYPGSFGQFIAAVPRDTFCGSPVDLAYEYSLAPGRYRFRFRYDSRKLIVADPGESPPWSGYTAPVTVEVTVTARR